MRLPDGLHNRYVILRFDFLRKVYYEVLVILLALMKNRYDALCFVPLCKLSLG